MLDLTLGRITPAGAQAFAIAAGIWAGILCGGAAAFFLTPGIAVLIGLGACAATSLASLLVPGLGSILYKGWNRTARAYSRMARQVVIFICYTIVSIVGLAGSSVRIRKPAKGESLWTPHPREAATTNSCQYSGGTGRERMGFDALADWARNSGNGWAILLAPFLALLLLLESDTVYEAPSDIYTLF